MNRGRCRVDSPAFIHHSYFIILFRIGAVDLYAIELRTADWPRLVKWYREAIGLRVLLRVEEDHYALLAAGSTRIAIAEARREERAAEATSVDRLIFEPDDFDAAVARIEQMTGEQPAVRREAEGFWQCATTDPDGRKVRLIRWPDQKGPRPDA